MRKDGAIFVHIDDEELHYLKVICDEAFGRNNFGVNYELNTEQHLNYTEKKLMNKISHEIHESCENVVLDLS